MELALRQRIPLESALDLQLLPQNPLEMAMDISRQHGGWLIAASHTSVRSVVAFSRRHRRWFILGAAAAAGYGAYKFLTLPSVARKRRRISKLLEALILLANAMSTSADSVVLISSDLNRFLLSDTDDIPKSLRQISKISASKEFLTTLSKASEALTKGILKAITSSITSSSSSSSSTALVDSKSKPFLEQLFERFTSASGAGFVSVVVGSFARNLVIAYYSIKSGNGPEGWVAAFCGEKGKELVAHCIQVFVSNAVKVYLNKSLATNTCDQIITSITHPKNEAKVRDLLVSVCNGAVETLVKTSHNLMITSGSSSSSASNNNSQKPEISRSGSYKAEKSGNGESGSIFSMPTNRRLMLDVTGRVTAEMVKSFLHFLLQKISDGAKKGYGVARDEVVERGMEVLRYLSAKSMTVFAVCLALCVQVSVGSRLLLPSS